MMRCSCIHPRSESSRLSFSSHQASPACSPPHCPPASVCKAPRGRGHPQGGLLGLPRLQAVPGPLVLPKQGHTVSRHTGHRCARAARSPASPVPTAAGPQCQCPPQGPPASCFLRRPWRQATLHLGSEKHLSGGPWALTYALQSSWGKEKVLESLPSACFSGSPGLTPGVAPQAGQQAPHIPPYLPPKATPQLPDISPHLPREARRQGSAPCTDPSGSSWTPEPLWSVPEDCHMIARNAHLEESPGWALENEKEPDLPHLTDK